MAASIADIFLHGLSNQTSPLVKDHRNFGFLPEKLLHDLGRERGLRITGKITSNFNGRGYCLGSALTVLSSYLHHYSNNEFLNEEILMQSYLCSMKNVIILQKLQEKFAGIEGHYSKKTVKFFIDLFLDWKMNGLVPDLLDKHSQQHEISHLYEGATEFLRGGQKISLRRSVLNYFDEKNWGVSEDLYTLILEVSGCYEKIKNPQLHRFHKLQKDILKELGSLCGMKVSGVISFYGDQVELMRKMSELPSGSYHLSFARHSCAYFKLEGDAWIWDCNYGFKKIMQGEMGVKKLSVYIGRYFRATFGWNAISRCTKFSLT